MFPFINIFFGVQCKCEVHDVSFYKKEFSQTFSEVKIIFLFFITKCFSVIFLLIKNDFSFELLFKIGYLWEIVIFYPIVDHPIVLFIYLL